MPRRYMLLPALLISLLALPAAGAMGSAQPASGQPATAAAKKKCPKGKKRATKGPKKGKCVKRTTRRKPPAKGGPIPADGSYYALSPVFIEVFVYGGQKKLTASIRIPRANMTCTPSGTPARGDATAKTTEMAINPDGSFEGDQSTTGSGSYIKGRFLSATRVELTGTATGVQSGGFDDTCSGSMSATVDLRAGRPR